MYIYLRSLTVAAVVISIVFTSCDRIYSEYLHDNFHSTKDQESSTLNPSAFRDSVNARLSTADYDKSLIYLSNSSSFQVERYSIAGKPVLYVEHTGQFRDQNTSLYYVKGGQIVKTENYSGKKPRQSAQSPANNHISYLEDAINQSGQFDLVFEGITAYPKARYLVLSRNKANSLRAPIRIDESDEFINELVSNPSQYRGSKLNIKWSISNNEAVYRNGSLQVRN